MATKGNPSHVRGKITDDGVLKKMVSPKLASLEGFTEKQKSESSSLSP